MHARKKPEQGMLIVLSGPSGAGKGRVTRLVLETMPELVLSVSVTTRCPRAGEREGADYFFATPEAFDALIEADGFLEHKCVFGQNRYGTPRAFVEEQRALGKDVLLEIDVKGALDVKNRVPDAVMIFLMPPSFAVLESRLRQRGTESDADIAARLDTAREELKSAHLYDYFIINDRLEQAAEETRLAIMAARLQASRRLDVIRAIMEGEKKTC